jgi:hypothetical protein
MLHQHQPCHALHEQQQRQGEEEEEEVKSAGASKLSCHKQQQ